MHLMLAQDEPADYVVGTGVTHSVGELVELAFGVAGLDWRDHVVTDAAFIRPAEVDQLCANPAKAASELGWEPKIGFEELVTMMVEADLELLSAVRRARRGLVRAGRLVGGRTGWSAGGRRPGGRPAARSGDGGADQAADPVGQAGRGAGQQQLAQGAAQERPVGDPGHQPAADERGDRGEDQRGPAAR